jgi:hypothetical protein
MWVKDVNSEESYIHVCNDSTLKRQALKNLEIRRHDIAAFSLTFDSKGKPLIAYLMYCPFCGQNLLRED